MGRFRLRWLLCSALLICCSAERRTAAPLKIMMLGNSITQASYEHYSYRYNLWKKLIDDDIDFDFVGSQRGNFLGNPSWPAYKGNSFDPDNEGHFGWRADEIIYGNEIHPEDKKLSDWLTLYTPDIVLMHLGSNDVFAYQEKESTIAELETIIDLLRADNPAVIVLVATCIPVDRRVNPYIIAFNELIPAMVERTTTAHSPVMCVDQYTGFDANEDTYDGVHPDESGEEKMAVKWYNAMLPFVITTGNGMLSTRPAAARAVSIPPVPAAKARWMCNGRIIPSFRTVSHAHFRVIARSGKSWKGIKIK